MKMLTLARTKVSASSVPFTLRSNIFVNFDLFFYSADSPHFLPFMETVNWINTVLIVYWSVTAALLGWQTSSGCH